MAGETDLSKLIAAMDPVLDPEPYVFCSFPGKAIADLTDLDPAGLFREAEGLTAILPAERALAAGLGSADWYRRITLTVHSSLEAVGLTAAVATALAERGIPANVVAAYYHDHVFVPDGRAEEAVAALKQLSTAVADR